NAPDQIAIRSVPAELERNMARAKVTKEDVGASLTDGTFGFRTCLRAVLCCLRTSSPSHPCDGAWPGRDCIAASSPEREGGGQDVGCLSRGRPGSAADSPDRACCRPLEMLRT